MMLERTLCGLELARDTRKGKATPYYPACKCVPRLWSSAATCHRCSCVDCAKARAKWDEHIKSGGILGEVARENEHAKRT